MKIASIDHIVLTVEDVKRTVEFYTRVLALEHVTVTRKESSIQALKFGTQRINLHERGAERKPNAKNALPGSQDICFITETPMHEIIAHLNSCKVPIEFGPIVVPGAVGDMESVYFRDTDGNLLELAVPIKD